MSQNATPNADSAPDQRDLETLATLLGQQQHAQAEALARKLIERHPAHAAAWQALGVSLRARGRIADAIEAQRQVVALLPWDAMAHHLLGENLMAMQQP